MQRSDRQLGPLETKFFTWAQSRRIETVRTGDLVRGLALSKQQEADLFKNMSRNGLIVKLIRGLYLVPTRLPPGGRFAPSPYLILDVLMRNLQANYQVTGLLAFNAHQLDMQVPVETCIYNTSLSGRRKLGGLSFLFIKVARSRLGGDEIFESPTSDERTIRTPMSSLPRVVIDAIYDYSRFNTLPRAYDWINDRKKDPTFIKSLIDMSIKYGNVSTRRRLGCLLELMKVEPTLIRPLERSVEKSRAFIPLIPVRRPSGNVNKKWGILVNAREQW